MNYYVSEDFDERVRVLVLGIECVDAMTRTRIASPVTVAVEGAWRRDGEGFARTVVPKRLERHASCRHALQIRADRESDVKPAQRALLWSHVALRIAEPARRYVPRRVLVPLPEKTGLVTVTANGLVREVATPGEVHRQWPRGTRRIHLFPGAAADLPTTTTVLRGRVVRGGAPVRWTRIVARPPNPTGRTECYAHGDDRGEFALVVPFAIDTTTLQLREFWTVEVWAPRSLNAGSAGSPPVPAPEKGDALFALPLERLSDEGPDDPFGAGTRTTDAWIRAWSGTPPIQIARSTSNFTIEVP